SPGWLTAIHAAHPDALAGSASGGEMVAGQGTPRMTGDRMGTQWTGRGAAWARAEEASYYAMSPTGTRSRRKCARLRHGRGSRHHSALAPGAGAGARQVQVSSRQESTASRPAVRVLPGREKPGSRPTLTPVFPVRSGTVAADLGQLLHRFAAAGRAGQAHRLSDFAGPAGIRAALDDLVGTRLE